ncbi:FAD-binding oxidoreductase [Zhouia sp. PK063]|uniref:FAD-binding oxidoreductase n=1 Tax=Zhouia sp. PK063 TaxID=3373602 RepID=UPI0037B5A69C
MKSTVKIKKVENINHNVKRFVTEKPKNYNFTSGQATHVSVNKPNWKEENRPFTFTSLNEDEDLEFTIKIYPNHHGVTDQLDDLKNGDELILEEPKGTIKYNGPGYFIAGGAGITPFISIFRDLEKKGELNHNILIFSNKTDEDIFLKEELDDKLKHHVMYIVTNQEDTEHTKGYIDTQFLKENITDLTKHFYVCGPQKMTKAVKKSLEEIGASPNTLVFEE